MYGSAPDAPELSPASDVSVVDPADVANDVYDDDGDAVRLLQHHHGHRGNHGSGRAASSGGLGFDGVVVVDGYEVGSLGSEPQGLLWGHPRGLYVLCATELWERYSYYAMRSLLVLFMRDALLARGAWRSVAGMPALAGLYGAPDDGADDETRDEQVLALASRVYGLYTALVYFTPTFGGYLADGCFGPHLMIVAGAILMGLGHGFLALRPAFLVGMGLIVLGNGCFKPNISTRVGSLYAPRDSRRDAAFSMFYCGINVGAMLAPLVAGSLRMSLGYEAGFGSAAVGMAACLATYLGFQWVVRDDLARRRRAGFRERGGARGEEGDEVEEVDEVEDAGGGGKPNGDLDVLAVVARHRARVVAILCVCVMSSGFWAVYEQQGNTTALFADERVDRGGMPTEFVQAVNPFMILALTPLMTRLWEWQARRGSEPTQITKMGIGAGLLSASYFLLAAASAAAASRGEKMGGGWLVIHLTLLTAGELYLSPVGLSFMTVAAPRELVSMMMGVWFLASFLGNYLSGELGALYAYVEAPNFFALMAVISAGVSVVMLAASKPLMRLLDPSRQE